MNSLVQPHHTKQQLDLLYVSHQRDIECRKRVESVLKLLAQQSIPTRIRVLDGTDIENEPEFDKWSIRSAPTLCLKPGLCSPCSLQKPNHWPNFILQNIQSWHPLPTSPTTTTTTTRTSNTCLPSTTSPPPITWKAGKPLPYTWTIHRPNPSPKLPFIVNQTTS